MGEVDRRAFGRGAEEAAVKFLQAQGYTVRARNFFCRQGELDVVAEKDDTVAFVEVRMRSSGVFGDPAETISRSKQRKVVRAALHYLFTHDLHDRMIRFDVITVVGRGDQAQVEHLPNAFDAGM